MQPAYSAEPSGAPLALAAVYTIKRPFWSILGRKFHVFAPDGSLVMFVRHPLMRLREELVVFTDESETRALIRIKARQLIALNVAHDVFDAATGQMLGSIRSRGLKSIVRDTWDILDANDQPVGLLEEQGSSILRRMIPLLTGKWHIVLQGAEVGVIRQIFHFFLKEYTLDLSMGYGRIHPQFGVACALLALMAETRRENR